jgi:uncharacterized UBP type Zn finger protein
MHDTMTTKDHRHDHRNEQHRRDHRRKNRAHDTDENETRDDEKTRCRDDEKTTKKPKTFTSVDIAREYNINPKTLRARIRRNIDKWSPLFANDERHVFVDNATTRKKVAALLNA